MTLPALTRLVSVFALFAFMLTMNDVTFVRYAKADEFTSSQKNILREAFHDAGRERWKNALQKARKSRDEDMLKVMTWMAMRGGTKHVSFNEISQFLNDNRHWPSRSALVREGEKKMHKIGDTQSLSFWFSHSAPRSVHAFIKRFNISSDSEKQKILDHELSEFWITLTASGSEERQFLKKFKKHLSKDDHIARMNRMLWRGQTTAGVRQSRLLSKGYQNLALARSTLRKKQAGVDGAIARVPVELRDDPGLIYERVKWRRRKDREDDAVVLLSNPSIEKGEYAPNWWKERHILARHMLRKGHISQAYYLAAQHKTTEGAAFAEAEWLAGWIALRFLNDYAVAETHFKRMFENVRFPVSQARGAYWTARALDAQGKDQDAAEWYGIASGFMTTFYGQQAAARLGYAEAIALPTEVTANQDDIAVFEQSELPRIIYKLSQIDEVTPLERLFRHLSRNATDPLNFSLVANLAQKIDRPELSIFVAKRAIRQHIVLSNSGYPTKDFEKSTKLPTSLIFGLIRQESSFNTNAISPVGARGLMQLMPATAKQVARQEGLQYRKHKLMAQPAFNIRLGSRYLADLIERYDGYLPMAIAAYNAGPSRVNRWIETIGDPRKEGWDSIDWIESIPFSETRNYVQRVLENAVIYDLLLDGDARPSQFFIANDNDDLAAEG